MLRTGNVLLDKRPAIAITVTDEVSAGEILRLARRRDAPQLVLEIRIDRFRRFDEDYILNKIRSLSRFKLPLIATIRSRKEGGAWSSSAEKRLQLFKRILPWVEAVDVELASKDLWRILVPMAHRRGKRVILSYHNFASTPPERKMELLIRKARQAGADLMKMAVKAKGPEDVARLLLLTQRHRDQGLITLAMGRWGAPSRILAPLFGSRLTYGFVGRKPQVPGQPRASELVKELEELLWEAKLRKRKEGHR